MGLGATTVLPISGSTLCYGSNDGGLTVLKKEEELSRKVKQACKWLHLKQHVVGKDVPLYGPGDLEGHKGKDGRFYVVGTCPSSSQRHWCASHVVCRPGAAVSGGGAASFGEPALHLLQPAATRARPIQLCAPQLRRLLPVRVPTASLGVLFVCEGRRSIGWVISSRSHRSQMVQGRSELEETQHGGDASDAPAARQRYPAAGQRARSHAQRG
jgi:hypothetical protein